MYCDPSGHRDSLLTYAVACCYQFGMPKISDTPLRNINVRVDADLYRRLIVAVREFNALHPDTPVTLAGALRGGVFRATEHFEQANAQARSATVEEAR